MPRRHATVGAGAAAGEGAPGTGQAARAAAIFEALGQRGRYDRRRKLYRIRRMAGQWPLGRWRYEHLWPFANAWSAVASLASLPEVGAAALRALPSFLDAVAAYRRPGVDGWEAAVVPPLGTGGDRYYDDNAWLGLAMVRHYEVTGDRRALGLASQAFAFVASGWSDEAGLDHPGGVRWRAVPACRSRHTCATAPAAQLGALVHVHSGDAAALRWAERAYHWVRAALGSPGGLYFDRIDAGGRVERTLWTYNQGSMVGAGVLLHRATGEAGYLADALVTTRTSVARFGPEQLRAQGPAFNAIYFRNLWLAARAAVGPGSEADPTVRALEQAVTASAAAYGTDAWPGHDDATGLVATGGASLNDSAPLIQVYALLAGAVPRA